MIKINLNEYHISIKTICGTEENSYSGITLLYLLKGRITVIASDCFVELTKQQIYLINKNVDYILIGNQYNILVSLKISNNYIIRYYPTHLTCCYCLPSTQSKNNFLYNNHSNNIKILIAKIAITYIQKSDQYLLDMNRLVSELLIIITSFCQIESNGSMHKYSIYSPKIEKVVQYIKNNFKKKLSLQEIAKSEYISFSHLSRLFKKEVGIGFSQYVNQLRIQYISTDLINTSKKVYQLAEENGFSDIKQFILQFKKKYGITPNQFRKNYQQGTILEKQDLNSNSIEINNNLSEVIYLLSDILHNNANSILNVNKYNCIEKQEINIVDKKVIRDKPNFCYTLFVGDINELLKQEVQKQLLISQKEIAVHYVEICNLITGDFILPKFNTDEYISTYNPYANTDAAINFLYKNNISLSIRIEHEHICNNIENNTKKITDFLKHCIVNFEFEYVQKWRFIYYIEKYSQLSISLFETTFELLFNTIKQLAYKAQFGIFYPFIHNSNCKDDPIFQNKIIKKTDFIGYSASFDENSLLLENEKYLTHYTSFIYQKTLSIKETLVQHGITKPLFLMQWNTLTGNTRKTNGNFFRGALLLQTLLDLSNEIKNITLVLNTNTQQEVKANHIDTSNIALFLIYETRRPIFFILKFIQKLKGNIIKTGKNYLITQNNKNYQIIITNISIFNPYLSIKKNFIHCFIQNRLLTITGIPSGTYQIKRYLFDQEHGALYRQYEKFQTQYQKNEEVFEYLAHITKPDFSIKDEYIDTRNWKILTELDINAIYFYELNHIHD